MLFELRIKHLFSYVFILSLLVSCSAPAILMKPAADKVSKFAIVSVSANRGVRNMDGQSTIGGIMAITSMVKSATEDEKSKKDDDAFDFGGNKMVDFALETFENQYATINGWTLVPFDQIMKESAYQKFKVDMEKYKEDSGFATLQKMASLSAKGTTAIPGHGGAPEEKQMLTQLAQELGLDAVVVLDLDMAYAASTAIGGTGTASAAVGVRLVMVNRFGDFAIKTPPEIESYPRVRSEDTVALVGGNIIYSSAAEAIFQDSISQGLMSIRDKINAELTAK